MVAPSPKHPRGERTPRAILEAKEALFARRGESLASSRTVDPVHLASTICVAMVFLVAGMPVPLPSLELDPLSPQQLERHRDEVLSITRRLLQERDPA